MMIKLIGATKHIPEGNRNVYRLKQQLPDKVRQMYWVTKANFSLMEKEYQQMNFDGVKLHQCWENFEMGGSWFDEVITWASENDLPVFIHSYSLDEVHKLIGYIKNHPYAKIIMAHLYGAELALEDELKYFENTYFDISNCYFVSKERIELVYRRFGGTKLLLGSDTPYGKDSLLKTMELVESLNIPASDKERILGTNMYELIR